MSSQVDNFSNKLMETGTQRCLNSPSDCRANGQIPLTKSKEDHITFPLFNF